jgi:hypothetical protein
MVKTNVTELKVAIISGLLALTMSVTALAQGQTPERRGGIQG